MTKTKINTDRNRFLAEAMGECYHSFRGSLNGRTCVHCGGEFWASEIASANKALNFYSWTGFGKLLDWAEKQDWWTHFLWKDDPFIEVTPSLGYGPSFKQYKVAPDRLADKVYHYLKNKTENNGCPEWHLCRDKDCADCGT